MEVENKKWSALSYEEKNHQLFLRQKALLDGFLEHGAITQAQHDIDLEKLLSHAQNAFEQFASVSEAESWIV